MINPNNPQAFAGSVLDGASIEEVSNSEGTLFNQIDPNLVIRHEKPEHRIVIMLKAQCHSNREICRLTGYSDAWVSQILRQPWARVELRRQIAENGGDEIGDLLAGAVIDSIHKIIDIRDRADDASVSLRAAQDLVDRHLGKATTRIESNATVHHLTNEVDELDRELARVEKELGIAIPSVSRN